jgi:hypothetical protein
MVVCRWSSKHTEVLVSTGLIVTYMLFSMWGGGNFWDQYSPSNKCLGGVTIQTYGWVLYCRVLTVSTTRIGWYGACTVR